MSAGPIFVLIAGAWHPASCFSILSSKLEGAGRTVHAYSLPTLNNAARGFDDDVKYISEQILDPLFAQGQEVLLVAHSYAGIPAGVAIKGQHIKDREQQGLPGGLCGVVFLAAFIMTETAPGEPFFARAKHWSTLDAEAGLTHVPDPVFRFMEDVDAEVAQAAVKNLRPHSVKIRTWEMPSVGYRDEAFQGCQAYIKCLQDNAVLPAAQDAMVQNSGVEWIRREIDSSHSPFLSKPEELTEMLLKLETEFRHVA